MKTEQKWTLIIMYQTMILVMLILETELYVPMYLLLFFQTGLLVWQTYELRAVGKLALDTNEPLIRQQFIIKEQQKTIEILRKELKWPK